MRNSVTLIGHLGKDPEVKTFGATKKAAFSIATTDTFQNQKGEKVQDVQWHNVVVWGKLATVCEKYLKKGQEVVLEGTLTHRVYETTGGDKRYVTEINVSDIILTGREPSANDTEKRLISAIRKIVKAWDGGDLAAAVREADMLTRKE